MRFVGFRVGIEKLFIGNMMTTWVVDEKCVMEPGIWLNQVYR